MSFSLAGLKAVIFDFGGTLDADGLDWFDRLHRQLAAGGLPLGREQVFEAARGAVELLYADPASARLSYAETVDLWIYWTIRKLELTVVDYKTALTRPFVAGSERLFSRNRALLERLAGRCTLAVLSNNFGNCAAWCADAGFSPWLATVVDSTAAGCAKPDRRIFDLTLERLGLPAAACAYVGDRWDADVEGARGAGLHPVWIRPPAAEPRPDRPGLPEERAAEDVTLIGSLADLLPMLGILAQPGRLLG
jgi:FMN phosphatase YigB (HAD superfamily)